MNYQCPVCGYDQMPDPPRDYNICPCCGVEYGLGDTFDSHRELRNAWLLEGAPWFSRMPPYVAPANWSAWDQLDNAGYVYDVPPPVMPDEDKERNRDLVLFVRCVAAAVALAWLLVIWAIRGCHSLIG